MTAPGAASFPVTVSELVRAFGSRRALDGVSFEVRAGECLALFGPNGAGKTTLLRVLAGLIKPTRGTVRIGGLSHADGAGARADIGLVSHHSMLYGALTARENVMFASRLYGVPDPRAAAERALDRLGVLRNADTPVRLLSRGMQQRVSIARAVAHEPRVVLADEPYSGLDAAGAAALTSLLRGLRAAGAALVVVTHNVGEGLDIASHAAVLLRGQFVRHDAVATLDASEFTATYRSIVAADAA